MKSYLVLLLSLYCFSGFSQTSINNYKYVLVPEKFSFLKEADQYRLNSITKSLLEENGFTAFFDNAEMPTELANNKCNALQADVTERKSMFTSRLTLLLKDCKGTVVFKSKEGNSREKDFALSYTLALRDAFTSLAEANYVYQPLPAANNQPQTAATASNNPPATQSAARATASPSASITGTLYAQPIANGYQLIDTTPKTVLRIFKSSEPDHFIAENGALNGIVFKRDNNWIFEYYKDGKLIAETLLIKF